MMCLPDHLEYNDDQSRKSVAINSVLNTEFQPVEPDNLGAINEQQISQFLRGFQYKLKR